LVTFLIISCGRNPVQTQSKIYDDNAEHAFKPKYLDLAYGSLQASRTLRGEWPIKVLSIGHTMASYQYYAPSPAYFHHGLDIRGNAGEPVYATRGGRVVNIENYMPPQDAYWEVAILDDEGFIWQYHHIDHNSIPNEIRDSYKDNTRIAAGTKLGEIFYWGVESFGERYHHIHLNIIDGKKNFLNPFLFLKELADNDAPQIVEIGLLQNGRKVSSPVSGNYSLYAKVHDLILHKQFVVPANNLKFQLDNDPEQSVWNFDNGLPGGSSNDAFVNKFFVPSLTCGNYTCRALYVDLGFDKTGNKNFTQSSGPHKIKVIATDQNGNKTEKSFNWTVR
jgi:hypothetical protein